MWGEESALELNRQLSIAYFSDHQGDLEIIVEGHTCTFPLEVWHAVLSVTDQWLEKYFEREGY